jgi:hypothetical protein
LNHHLKRGNLGIVYREWVFAVSDYLYHAGSYENGKAI